MERKRKLFILLTLFLATVAVALIVASLATDHWIKAEAVASVTDTNVTDAPSLVATISPSRKRGGSMTFGLFRGFKSLNYGAGVRNADLYVSCLTEEGVCMWYNGGSDGGLDSTKFLQQLIDDFHNQTVKDHIYEFGMFSAGLWVSTIVMVSLGTAMGLVAMGFALFNVYGKPIETLTGVPGLYLWNSLACLFTMLAIVVYLALYFQQFKDNVLPKSDLDLNLTSKDHADLDWSFYLVVVAAVALFLNPLVLKCSGSSVSCSFQREAEKATEDYPIY